jgi:hypothetical protein
MISVAVKREPRARTYPYMGEYKSEKFSFLVLFHMKGSGVVLQSTGHYVAGEHRHDWVEGDFTPIDYTITIQNT